MLSLREVMLFNHKRADFWLPNFGFKRSLLSLLKKNFYHHFQLFVAQIDFGYLNQLTLICLRFSMVRRWRSGKIYYSTRAVDSRDRALTLYAHAVIITILIMMRGSDQDSTPARFYVVSKRTPIIFSS